MKNHFQSLVEIMERLLGPGGCPWDQKQTFLSLQPYILEEVHEVIEAVDCDDAEKMKEELGDLLFTVVFYAKLGEKFQRFSLDEVLTCVAEKLIRRHPHVFGETVVKDEREVLQNWEKIKAKEKEGSAAKPADQEIPPTLPSLARAQKIIHRKLRHDRNAFPEVAEETLTDERIGQEMMTLLIRASKAGIDAEGALRRQLSLEK